MRSATLKIHPNSHQNPSKTLLKPAFEKRRVQNTPQNQFFEHLGWILVNFWRAPGPVFWISGLPGPSKTTPKSKRNYFFGSLFCKLFSNTILLRFRMVFMRPETLKIAIFLEKNNDFHRINVFEKTMQKIEFRTPNPFQNCSKISAKSQKIAFENKNKSQHASLQFFSKPPAGPELASTDSTPETKPKRPPKSHPFT